MYPDIAHNHDKPMEWLCERAILTPKNNQVAAIDDTLLMSFERELILRVGTPIMLLQNLKPPKLCNGTRLKVKALHRVSLMAISTQTGEMMGAALNSTVCRSDEKKQCGDENKSSKFNDILVILDKAGREIDIFGKYPNVDRIMKINIITVNEVYRGLGVCKALVNKSKYVTLHDFFINISIFPGQLMYNSRHQ
ncbi:PREDICTED: uncharacterized protein LOC107173797 [Diuraphis noxia]|uniref:uncharacterized protein LOC107173797 n=1 Tax=Diuraphis noxia TaxID=143948 RepID=UPI0007639671|nr:PREDICTED: uncharacterized protein LOC107173797 [Diuraphis noxia]